MRGLLHLKDVGNLVAGALWGGTYLLVLLGLWGRMSGQISHVASAYYILSQYATFIVISMIILSHLAISRFLFYKRSPIMGYGFLLCLLVPVLMILLFLVEISIHPPEEE